MSVYCPCEKKCSAYSGNNRRCKRIETSKSIPERFMHYLGRETGKAMNAGKWGNAAVGVLSLLGTGMLSNSDNTSYEVWRCPGCHCEVLYQNIKQAGGMRTEKLGEISSCK